MPDLTYNSQPFDEDYVPDFFRDWVTGTPRATSFLPRLSPEEIADRQQTVTAGAGFSEDLFQDRWASYLEEHGASTKAMDHFDSLRNGEVGVVMTGQQPGLFGGPLYTFYKAATACSLAHRLTENGAPSVPVFWNHSDDHDLSEIDRTFVLDQSNEPIEIRLGLNHQETAEIHSLSLPKKTKEALQTLVNALRDTEFLETNRTLLEESRREQPGNWFSGILHRLFADEGLLVFEPYLARSQWDDLLDRHLENWSEDLERLRSRGDELDEAGYGQPLDFNDHPNLFYIKDGRRTPVRVDGEREVEDWRERLENKPERFSPGAALRPVVQDAFFPVRAYVGGPGEITYHAQIGDLFDRLNVSRAPLFPRMSATIVERKVEKVIDKFELRYDRLFSVRERKKELLSSSVPASVDELFENHRAEIEKALDRLREKTIGTDQNLQNPWKKTRDHILEALDRYRENVEQSHRRKKNVGRQQLEKLIRNLFPNGKLQERVLSPWHYFTLYSLELADDLKELSSELLDRSDRHHFIQIT